MSNSPYHTETENEMEVDILGREGGPGSPEMGMEVDIPGGEGGPGSPEMGSPEMSSGSSEGYQADDERDKLIKYTGPGVHRLEYRAREREKAILCALAEAILVNPIGCKKRGLVSPPEQEGLRMELGLGWLKQVYEDNIKGIKNRDLQNLARRLEKEGLDLKGAYETVKNIYGKIRKELEVKAPWNQNLSKNCFASILAAKPEAGRQFRHRDVIPKEGEDPSNYLTASVMLTDFSGQGDTEFYHFRKVGEEAVYKLGQNKAWDGTVPHAGGANVGDHTRLSLFFIFDKSTSDVNYTSNTSIV